MHCQRKTSTQRNFDMRQQHNNFLKLFYHHEFLKDCTCSLSLKNENFCKKHGNNTLKHLVVIWIGCQASYVIQHPSQGLPRLFTKNGLINICEYQCYYYQRLKEVLQDFSFIFMINFTEGIQSFCYKTETENVSDIVRQYQVTGKCPKWGACLAPPIELQSSILPAYTLAVI